MRLRTYYNYPHIIQTSTTKPPNSCRRQHPATTWRVLCDDRRTLHESPGSRVEVSGGHFDKIQAKPPCIFAAALWCFSPGFSRKAGKNQGSFALDLIEQSPGLFDPRGSAGIKVASPWIESNCPPDSSTPVGWQPYTWRVTVGVQTVRIVRPHPPSNDC